ncbi:MAG: FeoB-associated Cys-rich membrane protein [Prevotella sp.]
MQTTITIIILAASVAYVSRRIYTLFSDNEQTKCQGCKGCKKDTPVKLR